MSVPTRTGPVVVLRAHRGGARTTASTAAAPPAARTSCPPAGEPGGEEQVLLDENVLAEGHDYFAVGQRGRQPRPPLAGLLDRHHRRRAATTCASAPSAPALRRRPPSRCADTGLRPGLVRRRRRLVFYVRLDEAHAPLPAVAPPARHRPGRATSWSSRRPTDRFSLGTGTHHGRPPSCSSGCTAPTPREWLAIPPDDPLAEHRGRRCRAARASSTPSTTLTPAAGGAGWFLVLTNDDAQDFRVMAAPDDAASGGDGAGARSSPHRPGVRLEDVDAFSPRPRAERARGGRDPGPRPPPARRTGPVRRRTCSTPAGSSRSPTARRRRGWGRTPSPTRTALRFGRTSLVTPSSRPADHASTGRGDAAQAGARPGRLRPRPYRPTATGPRAATGRGCRSRWCTGVGLGARRRPCLLYGYGAYEISIDPTFSPHRLSAPRPRRRLRHRPRPRRRRDGPRLVRGRADGAQGQHLLRLHRLRPASDRPAWHRPTALAGRGGSAGGLLIGAVANQAPELFRALVAEVPFVDCVTTMLDDDLPAHRRRVGGVGQPRPTRRPTAACSSYSPYDNVTGTNPDGTARTLPRPLGHRRAQRPPGRLTGSRPSGWPSCGPPHPATRVLLKTEMGAGHGGPSGRYDAWKEEALVYAFLLDALGLQRATVARVGPQVGPAPSWKLRA